MIVADVIDRKQLPDAPPREVESIALLSPSWPAQSAANGIASYVENLVSGMLAVGASPAVITANAESGSSDPILRQLRFPTGWRSRQLDRICYRIVGDKRVHWKMTTAIVRELAALRRSGVLDIVEMEESFGWANDVRRHGPVPTVVRLHGPWFLMGPLVGARAEGGFARRVRLEGRGIAHAAGVSAPSEDVLRRTKDHYRLTLKDAVVIPNPVPERPMDKRWTLEASDRNQILFVGRFDGHKGGDTIIDAFAMIAGRNRKACLAFVGPDRGFTDSKGKRWQIHQYMAHRISDPSARERVEYLGFKPPEEIEELRRRAMVTVVCSRYETFSMTAAEAMAGGCPIVATNTGGLAELIQHESNGLLCRPNDPSDLATKILSILDHPEMAASLGAQAARDAASRYHPNIVAQQSIEFYREVLARSHRNNSRK